MVDGNGIPHIAGLGNACVLPRSRSWTPQGETAADPLYFNDSHELTWPVTPSNTLDVPTKADNIYAFGVIAYEV